MDDKNNKSTVHIFVGIQTLQEREELRDFGPYVSSDGCGGTSSDVHSNRLVMHPRRAKPPAHDASRGGDSV